MFLQFLGGENAQGMELWNPETGSVTQISAQMPQEAALPTTNGLMQHRMMSINYNTELVIVGGFTTNAIADVWRYKYSTNSWKKLGVLSTTITQHASFLVYNVSCP